MKSPAFKTLTMAIVAAIVSAVAAAFYPWPAPVVVSAIVGKPLFESYDTNSVRSIRISKYNDERNGLDRMTLRRSGEKWTIPDFKKFIATNTRQIAAAANSLIDREVLVETTDQQDTYSEYGVVDPNDYQNSTNRSGLGTKIILENRNGQELASLIVGKPLKDDPKGLKHFVRIPGQPNVYVIDFDRFALSTDFRSWVNSNLFRLRTNEKVEKILVENYRLDPKAISVAKPQPNYRAALKLPESGGLALASLEGPGPNGGWAKAPMSTKLSDQFQVIAKQITDIQFTDVRKKTAALADMFKSVEPSKDDSLLSSLQPLGFVKTGFKNGKYEFASVGGKVSIENQDGVVVTLNIGSDAGKASEDMQLSYYALMTAGVNESIIPEPKKPEEIEDDAEANDKVQKNYLRLVKEREDKIAAAKIRAAEINQQHADWVYVVLENVIENIRPDVAVIAKPAQTGGASKPSADNSSIGAALLAVPNEKADEAKKETEDESEEDDDN
jgi:hypothetical protein